MSEQGLTPNPGIPVPVASGGTGATIAGATAANSIGALAMASNLSDLNSASTSLSNLGGVGGGVLSAVNQTSNFTLSLPANTIIEDIFIQETAGNAVTGGIKIGTTSGATDVALAIAVAGSSIQVVPDALILSNVFSVASPQTLFIQTVTLWNGASVNLKILYRNLS